VSINRISQSDQYSITNELIGNYNEGLAVFIYVTTKMSGDGAETIIITHITLLRGYWWFPPGSISGDWWKSEAGELH
jgi:hypothetical protein